MNKEQYKHLYKEFSHYDDPNKIRNKIKEYQDEQTLRRHKNIVKNYKKHKEDIEKQMEDVTKRIILLQNYNDAIHGVVSLNDIHITRGMIFDILAYRGILQDFQNQLHKLDMEYHWNKYYLQEYIKENI
jgi:hypothetical protein